MPGCAALLRSPVACRIVKYALKCSYPRADRHGCRHDSRKRRFEKALASVALCELNRERMCYFFRVGDSRTGERWPVTAQRFGSASNPAGGERRSAVTVRTGNRTYVFDESHAPIVIGRDSTAQVL